MAYYAHKWARGYQHLAIVRAMPYSSKHQQHFNALLRGKEITMSATVSVVTKSFFNEEKKEHINYKVLEIAGYVGGERFALEISPSKPLTRDGLSLAIMILNSTESAPEVSARKANEEEIDDFLNGIERVRSDEE